MSIPKTSFTKFISVFNVHELFSKMGWSGITIKQYKNLKGIKSQNLQDYMNETELTLLN